MWKLQPHQRDIVLPALLKYDGALLFAKPRVGKVLPVIRRIRLSPHSGLVLITAPYGAMESWRTAFRAEGIDWIEFIGSADNRFNMIDTIKNGGIRSRWVLTNHESWYTIGEKIVKKEKKRGAIPIGLHTIPWGWVIIDEAHAIKDPRSGISRYYLKYFSRVKYRYALTGTPVSETDLNIVPLILWAMADQFPYKSYWEFRAKKCRPDWSGHKWSLTPSGRKWLVEWLSERAIFLSKEDAGIEVDRAEEMYYVEPEESLLSIFEKIEREYILALSSGEKKTSWTMQTFSWLRRGCAGVIDGEVVSIAKCEKLKELLSTILKNEKIVIWIWHQDVADHILTLLYEKIDHHAFVVNGLVPKNKRQPMIDQWSRSTDGILLAQPDCLSEGADLSAADCAVYYEQPLGRIAMEQSQERIFNLTKKTILRTYYIVMKGTIDEDVHDANITKASESEVIAKAVTAIQKRVVCRSRT